MITWRHGIVIFTPFLPLVRGIHRSSVVAVNRRPVRRDLMFSQFDVRRNKQVSWDAITLMRRHCNDTLGLILPAFDRCATDRWFILAPYSSNSIANALDLLQSYIKPSRCPWRCEFIHGLWFPIQPRAQFLDLTNKCVALWFYIIVRSQMCSIWTS